jgi:hypothetical protein
MLDILVWPDSSATMITYGNLCTSENNIGGSIDNTVQYSPATL